jgi:hypothetical protein
VAGALTALLASVVAGALSPQLAAAGGGGASQPTVRPIIFIPGIEGSFLTDANGNETWPQVANLTNCIHTIQGYVDSSCEQGYLGQNAFAPDGQPALGNSVDVANGVQHPVDPPPGPGSAAIGGALTSTTATVSVTIFDFQSTGHFYDITAQNASASGYTVVQDDSPTGIAACTGNPRCFVPVGVDWRRSASDNAQRVLSILQQVLVATGADKVDILAHSQGGLIATALTKMPATVGKIYRVVTLGTPNLGAPKALSVLLYQEPCLTSTHYFGCPLSPNVVQGLVANYPGAYELLPDAAYFDANPFAPLAPPGVTTLSFAQEQTIVTDTLAQPPLSRDATLATAASAWHHATDAWAPADSQIGLVRMVGYDATDAGTNCTTAPCSAQQAAATATGTITSVGTASPNTLYHGTGDGTVPLYSASVYNRARGFDDRGLGHNMYWCGYSHMGLAQSTAVWTAAESYLEGASTPLVDTSGALCPDGTQGSLAGLSLIGAPSNSATTLTSSANPTTDDHAVTFTAVPTPSTATGTVTFFDGSTPLGSAALSGGAATYTTASLAPGSHTITASYGGDASDNPSTSAVLPQVVNPGPTSSLTVTGPPAAGSSPIVIAVAARDARGYVTPAYTGAIHFTSTDPQASLPADYQYTAADAGTHSFTVTLRTQGVRSISATDSGAPSISGITTVTVTGARGSGYIMDAFGGLHPYGGAPPAAGGPYWPNWAIARAMVAVPGTNSGYILDGFGGVHPFGGAPPVDVTGYWPNWDIARSLVLRSDGHSGYVLDGFGHVHPFVRHLDAMLPTPVTDAYWPNVDIARDLVLASEATGYVVDGYGGVHAFGGAIDRSATVTGYTPGKDVVHRVLLRADHASGYVLDGYGNMRPFGGAPALTGLPSWPTWNIARGAVLLTDGSSGYIVDGFGGTHPFGTQAPSLGYTGYWPNWDVIRGMD